MGCDRRVDSGAHVGLLVKAQIYPMVVTAVVHLWDGVRRSFGEGALKLVRGMTAASRDLLWPAIMLALYYTSLYGSLQMTSFARDLDNVTRRHTQWSSVLTCGSPVVMSLGNRPLPDEVMSALVRTEYIRRAWSAQPHRPNAALHRKPAWMLNAYSDYCVNIWILGELLWAGRICFSFVTVVLHALGTLRVRADMGPFRTSTL